MDFDWKLIEVLSNKFVVWIHRRVYFERLTFEWHPYTKWFLFRLLSNLTTRGYQNKKSCFITSYISFNFFAIISLTYMYTIGGPKCDIWKIFLSITNHLVSVYMCQYNIVDIWLIFIGYSNGTQKNRFILFFFKQNRMDG